ncbi:MAG: exosortase/archaeosortase family protein [Patescibacteria group bacterium]
MEKRTLIQHLFLITSITFMLLPLIVTLSAILTSVLKEMSWYRYIEMYIVPFESRMVLAMVRILGIPGFVSNQGQANLYLIKAGVKLPIKLEWNCLGWQSLVFLCITLITGLRGTFTTGSKFTAVVIGILGTVIINLFRISIVLTLAYYWNAAAIIVHDYFAAFFSLIWLFGFWWFAYKFILDEKEDIKDISNKAAFGIK